MQAGKYKELLQSGTDFSTLISAHNEALESMQMNANMSNSNVDLNNESDASKSKPEINNEQNSEEAESSENTTLLKQLVKEEERERGQVNSKVYWAYITEVAGGAFIPVYLLAQIGFQAMQILNSYWMAWGTSATESGSPHVSTKTLIIVYVLLAFARTFCMLVRTIIVSIVGLKTAQNYFPRMLWSIFRAPMSFFDSTPSGRILSRVCDFFYNPSTFVEMW